VKNLRSIPEKHSYSTCNEFDFGNEGLAGIPAKNVDFPARNPPLKKDNFPAKSQR